MTLMYKTFYTPHRGDLHIKFILFGLFFRKINLICRIVEFINI